MYQHLPPAKCKKNRNEWLSCRAIGKSEDLVRNVIESVHTNFCNEWMNSYRNASFAVEGMLLSAPWSRDSIYDSTQAREGIIISSFINFPLHSLTYRQITCSPPLLEDSMFGYFRGDSLDLPFLSSLCQAFEIHLTIVLLYSFLLIKIYSSAFCSSRSFVLSLHLNEKTYISILPWFLSLIFSDLCIFSSVSFPSVYLIVVRKRRESEIEKIREDQELGTGEELKNEGNIWKTEDEAWIEEE